VMAIIDFVVGSFVLPPYLPVQERIISPYYHHDLKPLWEGPEMWAADKYIMYTNNLGFKDSTVRSVPLVSDKHRIVFIGDSFTEGIGIGYDETFVGLISKTFEPKGYDVLNAGVASYAPSLYYWKMKYWLEHGLKFDELMVFIDVSDTQDELEYHSWTPTTPYSLGILWEKYSVKVDRFFEHHSLVYLHIIRPILQGDEPRRILSILFGTSRVDEKEATHARERGLWPIDDEIFERWGKQGVEYEKEKLESLIDLSKEYNFKISMAVYPWPVHVQEGNLDSRQVTIWREFTKEYSVDFYNFFPAFISTTTESDGVINRYYLPNDTHWNEAGHQVIAQEWLKQYISHNK
jgi:hypothetical protein